MTPTNQLLSVSPLLATPVNRAGAVSSRGSSCGAGGVKKETKMKLKITISNGKYTIIALHAEAGKSLPALSDGFESQSGKILRQSSTSAQPYICANYDAIGNFVGGKTLGENERKTIIEKMKLVAGAKIEELA